MSKSNRIKRTDSYYTTVKQKGQTGSICAAHYLMVFDMWSEMPIARNSKCCKCEIQLNGSTQSRGPSRQQTVLQDRVSFSNSSSKKANRKMMIKDCNREERHKNFDRLFFFFFLFHKVQKEILVDSFTVFVVLKSLDIRLVEGNVITQK